MPNYWILKTEPTTYSLADLARDGRTRWDGVTNPVALKNLRAMAENDQVMIYHTGDEKSVVGLARVIGAPYADPKNAKLAVVDLEYREQLPKAVSLAQIKADPAFADLALVRQGRLSVVVVPADLWKRLLRMGGIG